MGPAGHPSITTLIESALDETIAHLSRSNRSPQERAILIEARRLRSMIASWRAIPPRPSARKEVFASALQLFKKAGAGAGASSTGALRASELVGTVGAASPVLAQAVAHPADAPDEAVTPSLRRDAPGEAETPPAHPSAPLLAVIPPDEHPTPTATARAHPSSLPPSSGARRARLGPGVVLVRPGGMEWRPFPLIHGVTVKVLHRADRGGAFRALVRMEPGTELPRHRHAAAEEIFILEGTATLGGTEARAGEFCHAEPGSVHEAIKTTTGCTFFLVGSELDEIVSG